MNFLSTGIPCKAFLRLFLLAGPAMLMLLVTTAAIGEETRSFQRLGLTIELPVAFGDPMLDLDNEIRWADEAAEQDAPGILIVLSLEADRALVVNDLVQQGTILDLRKVMLGPRGFERYTFEYLEAGVSGIVYLSDEAYEGDHHVFLALATPPENFDAVRDEIEALAARIERVNRIE